MGWISAGLAIAGGLFGKSSSDKAAKQAQAAAAAQARAARLMAAYNAKQQRRAADLTIDSLRAETDQYYKIRRTKLAGQEAALTKTNVMATSETSLKNRIEAATETELSIQNFRRNKLLEVDYLRQDAKRIEYAGKINAQNHIAQGQAASAAAKSAGMSSLIGGFTKAAGFLDL